MALGQEDEAEQALSRGAGETRRARRNFRRPQRADAGQEGRAAQRSWRRYRRGWRPIPSDHQARYDLATALNAMGEREQAAEALLEIMRRDRKWNEDAARLQLLKFFEAWGSDDPATAAARRRLSAILFS